MRNANGEKGLCVTFDCRLVIILRKALREDPSNNWGGCALATSEKTIAIVTCVTLRKFP